MEPWPPAYYKVSNTVCDNGLHTHTHCMFFGFEIGGIDGIDVPESPKRPGDEKFSTSFLTLVTEV